MIARIVFFILLYFFYRSAKSWFVANFSKSAPDLEDSKKRGKRQLEGEMIKDPYCNVYFSKDEGVSLEIDGSKYMFCSTKCRDAFISSRK